MSATCLTSGSQQNLNVSVTSSATTKGITDCVEKCLSRHARSAWNISSSHNLSKLCRRSDDGFTDTASFVESKDSKSRSQFSSGATSPSFLFARQHRNYLTDVTTGVLKVLIGDYECASGVTGIQFNAELEQVATSHNCLQREDATRHVGDFFKQSNLKAKTLIYNFSWQIHGTESTVQLWQLTSNKLNPIQKISCKMIKTWTTLISLL